MSLEYYIISKTTGDENSSSQVLTQNTLAYNNNFTYGSYFSYNYPVYTIEGATFDYYSKDFNSISYDISNGKSYNMFFNINLESVCGTTAKNTIIQQDLYRLTFEDYTNLLENFNDLDAQTFFDIPLTSIYQDCSGLTIINSALTINFPTQYKDVGQYTKDVFFDKSQYFIDTSFIFERKNDLTIGDAYYINTNPYSAITSNFSIQKLYLEPSATTMVSSNLGIVEITGDTLFSGTTVKGSFFSYFVPPKKPDLNVSGGRQKIAVEGSTRNLSPVFNFANVDDGDYYQLQVNYNTTDTSFSGTEIFTYQINKQIGDAEFVRTYSTPLRANDSFIYRIGNTKQLDTIFGSKQTLTTWSDYISASIVADGKFKFSGTTWLNYISNLYSGSYSISGLTVATSTPSISYKTYEFNTNLNSSMVSGTISASTSATSLTIQTTTIDYNGSVSTLDWKNAIYSATNFSNLGIYISGANSSTAVTTSNFNFTTKKQSISGATIYLSSVTLNSEIKLSIDLKSSEKQYSNKTKNYNDSNQVSYTRISDENGNFDFDFITGGYYRLIATAPSYLPYFQNIDTYFTLNADTNLDLIFQLNWSNPNQFQQLSNYTFL